MSQFRNRLYYGLKPLIPAPARHILRKWYVQRQRKHVGKTWPILPGSERPPDGWSGWPHGKKFALVLTHDVEGQRGVDKCRQLMELEIKCGFRSSFNFIPEGTYQVKRELRECLARNKFETGIHDLHHDGRLYKNRRHFAQKAAQINQHLKHWGAVGFRSGFMLHNLEWLHDLDIEYDASTFDTDPFEPQPDNLGTIFPFWVAGKADKGYLELPYTLPQDSTLFLLLGETSPNIWFKKLDWIAQHGGMALINVHPDYLRFAGEPVTSRTYAAAFYESFLRHVAERYAGAYWHVLPKELAAWHRNRNAPVTERTGRSWAAADRSLVPALPAKQPFQSMRAAVILFADYASDARPRNEAETLVRSGMEVDVISLREDSGSSFREKIDGVNLFQIPLRRRRSHKIVYILQYTWFFAASFLLLSTLALRRRYRLVHVHNMPDFLVFSALLPRLRGAKIVLDLHDPMPELFRSVYGLSEDHWMQPWLKRMERHSIAFADLVLTPNKAFKDLFVSRSCPPEKIHIVMNSPNQTMFNPEAYVLRPQMPRSKSFTLMYHGLLVERHGLDVAVYAMAKVVQRMPDIKLYIYGSPMDYMDGVMKLVRDLGLQDVVQYRGSKSLREIAEALTTIDLGLVPNRLSSFTQINLPTRIFECLAMNKPVLVPRTQGIADYFTDENMLFFDPENIDDLARKIEWAAQNQAPLRQLLERGREVYKKHCWDAEAEQFEELVQNLLEKKITAPSSPPRDQPRRMDGVGVERFNIAVVKAKPKIWIDLDNTPHVVFFEPIMDELRSRGYPLFVTARDAFQVCELADRTKLSYTRVGRHYGKNPALKVAGLLIRAMQLAPFAWREKPALSLSHGARSQIVISNALGIPSLLLADYEYAKYPPLMRPTWEMVPSVIPDEVLCRDHQHIFRYPGIKEDAYVWKFQPNHGILQELGLSPSDVIVTVRPPATEAHYHNPASEKLFINFMDYACRSSKTRLVLLPRNQHQSEFIRSHWPQWFENNKTVIPPAVVNGLNLIWHSDLLVSGGGTMNREAAVLGVPVYSIFLGAIGAIDRHLEESGRLILIKSVEEIAAKIRLEKRPPPSHSNGKTTQTLQHIVNTIEELAGGAPITQGS
jgi:uncharacterized protein